MPSWNVELTYAQALERTARAATLYRALGYGPGHRVALQLENRPEFLLHFLALNSLGVSVVPLNPDYREAELGYLLEHSEASALVNASARELADPASRQRANARSSTPRERPASPRAACSAISIS
jgi:crotonobetaine/carnitine-CoA ligase